LVKQLRIVLLIYGIVFDVINIEII